MRKVKFLLVSLIILSFSSCGKVEPTIEPTVKPTEEPTVELTTESTEEPKVMHDVFITFRNREYSMKIADGNSINNVDIFSALGNSISYWDDLFNYDLYFDEEYELIYNGESIDKTQKLFLKSKEVSFEEEDFKVIYDYINYFYECKYPFEECYEYVKNQIDISKIEDIYEDYYCNLDGDNVSLSVECRTTDGNRVYVKIPLINHVVISVDTYFGGCIYEISDYFAKVGEDFVFPDGISVFSMSTMTLYEGVIEDVNESRSFYLYLNGVYKTPIIHYLAEQSYLEFDYSERSYFYSFDKYKIINLSSNTFKIDIYSKTYYFMKSENSSGYRLYRIDSKYALIKDKTYDETVEIMALLAGNKKYVNGQMVFKAPGLTIYLNDNLTYTLEFSYNDEEF